MILLLFILLREALFTSVRTVKTGMYVRPSVRSSVRIFSDFCEEDTRGGHMPLSLGVLNYEFEGFWKNLKKSARSVHINGICSQEKSGFGSILVNFFETFWKRSLWRRLRHLEKAGELKSLGCYVRGRFSDLPWRNQCFAPLPCAVYLVSWFSIGISILYISTESVSRITPSYY